MSSKVYLNPRSGLGRELAVLLSIGLILLIGAVVVCGLLLSDHGEGAKRAQTQAAFVEAGNSGGCLAGVLAPSEETAFDGTFYTCSTKDVKELWQMIRSSPYVKGNTLYETIIQNAGFVYEPQNDAVNAFAASMEKEQVRRPVVCLLGGAARFSKLVAYARALDLSGVTSNASVRVLAELERADCTTLSEARAEELFTRCKFVRNDSVATSAKAIQAGMLLGILAHEAGHHVYGHVHNGSGLRDNREISRNQEREADSFSASIMSASPWGKYMFEGTAYWWWMMSKREGGGTSDANRSHPRARERLENLIRSNREKAVALGLIKGTKDA